MLERVHRKILRTIQGLPTRCPSTALNCLLGTIPINKAIVSRKLNFVFSILSLNPSSLARTVLLKRLGDHGQSSIIHSWALTLEEYALPSIPDLVIALPCSKLSWKNSIKLILAANEYALLTSQCGSIPISKCAPKSITNGRIFPHWMVSKGDRQMLQRSNFRVRLLVNCDGLEADAARFRGNISPLCKLCRTEPKSAYHFAIVCPALQDIRDQQLPLAPGTIALLIPSPILFFDFLLGTTWIEDIRAQKFAVDYLHKLRLERAQLITTPVT